MADLKSLEKDGINVDGKAVKGGLYCIAGDHLGSNCIGGFTENFSPRNIFAGIVKLQPVSLRLIQMLVVHHSPQRCMTQLVLISMLGTLKASEE